MIFLFCRYFKAPLRASLGRLDQRYHRGRPIAYGSRALLNWRHSGVLDKHTALVRLVIYFHEIDKKSSIDYLEKIIAKLLKKILIINLFRNEWSCLRIVKLVELSSSTKLLRMIHQLSLVWCFWMEKHWLVCKRTICQIL